MTNYQKGYAFERQVKKILESKGYYVMRSAGSHTVIDLIAFKEDELLLIQLKSSSKDKEPDVKQLLKDTVTIKYQDDWTQEVQTRTDKSNVRILEELKVPLLQKWIWSKDDWQQESSKATRKIILWKGKGRQNIYQFEYLNSKWVLDNKHHILNMKKEDFQ